MKHNKFSKFIERILICLPLIFLGANILYISLNENAKDSYYGDELNSYTDTNFTDYTNIVDNELYYYSRSFNTGGSFNIYFTNVDIIYSNNMPSSALQAFNTYDYFRLNIGTDFITLYYSENGSPFVSVWVASLVGNNVDYVLRFNILSLSNTSVIDNGILFTRNYNQYSFLNNTLPYAMNEFNKLGFGKIDFVGWFVNIFMNNQFNNVYVTFINAYINYFLFVECSYFIPMVFYWFIHFGERLVDRFTGKTESW